MSSTVHATYNGGSGQTVSISGASAYTYLALVVKAKGGTGQTAVVISELRFFATNANLSKKFLRSSGVGIAWDDVSSTLQAITDGGATTNNEISFTNGVTSLTASGNVVATGNVTASTFKSTSLGLNRIPYTNNDNELVDSAIIYDSTTNNTFVASNLYVTGNLTVQGTTTFQDSNIPVSYTHLTLPTKA